MRDVGGREVGSLGGRGMRGLGGLGGRDSRPRAPPGPSGGGPSSVSAQGRPVYSVRYGVSPVGCRLRPRVGSEYPSVPVLSWTLSGPFGVREPLGEEGPRCRGDFTQRRYSLMSWRRLGRSVPSPHPLE